MSTLDGKVALVTGAASGIGAATARALAERGVRLILLDVNADALAPVAAELDALAVVADVRDLGAVQAAVDAGVAQFGGIDLVLANAGIISYGSVLAVDPGDFKRVLDINVLGVFHTVRAALPSVLARRGYILVVSSLAAFIPGPGLVAYCASKAGVEHLANALRTEVAARGVAVGTAHPTYIDTPLVRDGQSDLASFGRALAKQPRPLRRIVPLKDCVEAFVDAFEHRGRRVYVPRWVGTFGWVRMLATTRLGGRQMETLAASFLPEMDAEVAALGRSTSARNDILS